MTAPETWREIPADELVERLRRHAADQIDDDLAYVMVADDLMEKAADLIEAQVAIMADRAARLASLEGERARTVKECARIVEARDVHLALWQKAHYDAGRDRAGEIAFERRQEVACCLSDIRALASEKGQANQPATGEGNVDEART